MPLTSYWGLRSMIRTWLLSLGPWAGNKLRVLTLRCCCDLSVLETIKSAIPERSHLPIPLRLAVCFVHSPGTRPTDIKLRVTLGTELVGN